MDTKELNSTPNRYKPTPEQISRREELRRFNRYFIYLPIGFATLISFLIVLSMVLYIILAPSTEYLVTVSAIADAVLIITSSVIILVLGLFIAAAVGIFYQARKNGTAPIYQTQVLFWRIEVFIMRIYRTLSEITPKIAAPFITIGARIAYLRTLPSAVHRSFRRG